MHSSIHHYNIKPGSADEISRRVERGFLPILTQSPGFVSYNLVDTGNGTLVSISTFESETEAENSNRLAAGWVKENIAEFVNEPPTIMKGKVGVYKIK